MEILNTFNDGGMFFWQSANGMFFFKESWMKSGYDEPRVSEEIVRHFSRNRARVVSKKELLDYEAGK